MLLSHILWLRSSTTRVGHFDRHWLRTLQVKPVRQPILDMGVWRHNDRWRDHSDIVGSPGRLRVTCRQYWHDSVAKPLAGRITM